MLPAGYLQAQQHTHPVSVPVFSSIENARTAGELTLDEALLQTFYAGYRPSLLHDRFRAEIADAPVKCMVPAMMQFHQVKDRLSASAVSEIEELTQSSKSSTAFSYQSPSGNFIFHYDTTGTDRVPSAQTLPEAIEEGIPDYIYHAAFAADSSYRYQVEELGFTDFILEEPYVIDFRNFGFYGTTTVSGSTTFITVHSNFRNFPPNTHPEGNQIGSLYVTLAHEIKHAIQYAANRWRGSAGSFNWIEMDATKMEEIVFHNVNDYHNYIKESLFSDRPNTLSIFGNPQNPIPGAYWHVTWMLYFAEEYGMDFWVDVWEDIQAEPLIPFAEAIDNQLAGRGQGFGTNHLRNHLWHLSSGERFPEPDFGFRERGYYPNASINAEMFTVPDSLSGTGLRSLAAQYVRASASTVAIGQPNIRLQSSAPGVGIGVIGVFADGTTQKLYSVNETASNQQIQTPWTWNQLEDLYIAIVNTNQSRTADYTLIIDSILPDEDLLAQNFPNPFRSTTRIEFSLNEPKHVRVDVHDSIGRRISTLVNDSMNEGFHYVDFDGSALASGVYFYRIITDQTVTTNKMMLIK
jgi:hypothetical protein